MGEKLFPIITKHFYINPVNKENPLDDNWTISMKTDEAKEIGTLHFENAVLHGEVKLSVDLLTEYEKSGYYSEIFYSMARFAFQSESVREISTTCRYEKEHLVKGLEKAGFVRRETKDGIHSYSMKKQKTAWTGLYVFIGLIAGFFMGVVFSNLWMGTIAGILIGAIIGYILDKKEDKEPGHI